MKQLIFLFILSISYSCSTNSDSIDLDLRGTSWQGFEDTTYFELSIDSAYRFTFYEEFRFEKQAKINQDTISFLSDKVGTYTKMVQYSNDTLSLHYYDELKNKNLFLVKMPYITHNTMEGDDYHLDFLTRNPYININGKVETYTLELSEGLEILPPNHNN